MKPNKPQEIPLVVVGCDFRNAAVNFRGKLFTTPEARVALHRGICHGEAQCGFAALETCNRVEWIVSTRNTEWIAELLIAQMQNRWTKAFPSESEYPVPYVYHCQEAAQHLLRVAAGLESVAAGEAQIAGQLQDALRRARETGMSSDILNGLATTAGHLAKAGLRIGFRSDHRRGVHGMAADFLRQHFGATIRSRTVVVAGMGSIGRKAAEVLESQLGCKTVRVNRTVASLHTAAWQPLSRLAQTLQDADALLVATGSLKPVIEPAHFILNGRGAPLLVLDIGIPRQVDPAVDGLKGVEYRNLDDLIARRADDASLREVRRMEEAIEKELRRFKRFCIERNIVSLLEETQRRRQFFIQSLIPEIVGRDLGELDERKRKQVEAIMKQLISDYTSDSFESIHEALDNYWATL
jgi:glutamyl-tRNA reductase